jgi:hypothetical protein
MYLVIHVLVSIAVSESGLCQRNVLPDPALRSYCADDIAPTLRSMPEELLLRSGWVFESLAATDLHVFFVV